MANAFKIIASGLLNTFMSGNGSISSSSSQVLAIFVWNVDTFSILVAFGKTKVNDVDVISGRVSTANKEIVWFDITMDKSLFMDLHYALDKLNCNSQDSL